MNWKIFNMVTLLILICIGILLVFIAWVYSTLNPVTTLEISAKDWLQLSLASLWLLLTSLWFFFWYAKFNQDKELEIIEKYTKKYDEIWSYFWFDESDGEYTVRDNKNYYKKILSIWYEEYYLNEKWYIPKSLWTDWSRWIRDDIEIFLNDDYYIDQLDVNEEYWFARILVEIYLDNSLWFYDFIFKMIESCISKLNSRIINDYTDEKWTVTSDWIWLIKNIENYEKVLKYISFKKLEHDKYLDPKKI